MLYDGGQPVCELSSSGTVTAQTIFGANGLVSRSTPGGGTVLYALDERDSHSLRSGQIFST